MIRKIKYLCLPILLLAFSFLNAASPEGEGGERSGLVFSGKKKISSAPGSLLTVPISFTHQKKDTIRYQVDYQLPSKWQVITASRDVTFRGYEKKSLLLSLKIPRDCLPGDQQIGILMQGENEETEFFTVPVSIDSVQNIKVSVYELPGMIVAGDTIHFKTLVRNSGNTPELVDLKLENGMIGNGQPLTILPGESVTLEGEAYSNARAIKNENSIYRLDYIYGGQQKSEFLSVEVVPLSNKEVDIYERMPTEIGLIYLGRQTSQPYADAFQIEARGSGEIDTAKGIEMEYLIRTPDRQDVALFSNFDEYYLKITSSEADLTAGDYTLRVSRLAEENRFGRGLDFEKKFKNVSIGSFYQKARFFADINDAMGVYTNFSIDSSISGKGYSFVKRFTDESRSIISGGTFNYNYKQNFLLTSELSSSVNSDNTTGYALQTGVMHNLNNLSYFVDLLYADKNYYGFYQNSVFLNSNVRYKLDRFTFSIGTNINNVNPSLDTLYIASPYSRNYNAGIDYRISPSHRVSVFAIQRFRSDRLRENRFNYEEQVFRLAYRFRKENWNLYNALEYGRARNFRIEGNNFFDQFNLQSQLSYNLSKKISFGLNSQLLNTVRYTEDSQELILIIGGEASYRRNKNFSTSLKAQTNYLREEYTQNRNLFTWDTDWRFNDNHSVNASFNYTLLRLTTDRTDFFISARYKYNFGVPIRKKNSFGKVKGRIISEGGAKVNYLPVRLNGHTAITDNKGNFVFENIPVGTYNMTIDQRSFGPYEMVDKSLFTTIAVTEGDTVEIYGKVVKGGKIKGRIVFSREEAPGRVNTKEKKGRKAMIYFTNEKEQKVTVTDNKGRFEYGILTPGIWNVKVVPTGWKDDYTLDANIKQVEIKAESDSEVVFRATPKKRRIRFLQDDVELK